MSTTTTTETYSTVDVENVVRRLKADLVMIADSTGGWTAKDAADYAHDVEVLAKAGYLAFVDVTLFSGATEVKAVRYDVDVDAGSVSTSRPGGVLWPMVASPSLRMILGPTDDYDGTARGRMAGKLRNQWSPTNDDTSHPALSSNGGRNYVSNAYGIKRKDWTV